MQSVVIFPQTIWRNSDMGFSAIQELQKTLQKSVKLKMRREYQAVIFELDDFNDSIFETIRQWLPDDYQLPSLVRGQSAIISSKEFLMCNMDDKQFQSLLQEAHLSVTKADKVEDIPELTLHEINTMCNEFSDAEGIPMALKELDIERILQSVKIDAQYERTLAGILVDLKAIWFALDYDMIQLGRNTGTSANERFKRYMCVNNAIVRVRALWEKLMAFAVLIERPEDLDKILSARRVRSTFVSNFENATHPITKQIWDYIHSLDTFEQRFRTPEMHKVGRTIWWAARERLGEEANRFIAFRNDLNLLMRSIVGFYVSTER